MELKNKHLLFGIDEEPNIVAVEPIRKSNKFKVYKREGDDVKLEYKEIDLFFYTTKQEAKKLSDAYRIVPLLGENHYDVLVHTPNISAFYDAKRELKDTLFPYSQTQYLLKTGKTLFKGMEFSDTKMFFFDLETNTKKGYNFSNAVRDEIIMISMKTNKGFEKVLCLEHPKAKDYEYVEYCEDEKQLLNKFIYHIRTENPDIIANHNIFGFDFPYLIERAKQNGVELRLGRDGSPPNTFDTTIKFADKSRDYTNVNIHGRHVIDTQFLAMYADVVLRNMPSYRLKDLVKYLGKASEDRVYIDGADICVIWRDEHETKDVNDLLKYALDDVYEAEILLNEYGMSTFTMTQMVPMPYQDVFRYGTGNQIEYVFMREYIRQSWSFPKPDDQRKYGGGYAACLSYGLVKEPIIYADVKSLYPSLAKILGIQPKKDELGIFQQILELLMNTRFDIKKKIKEFKKSGDEKKISMQKALDGSIKIFLNTMSYGYIGWAWGAFNDYDEAERITVNGQRVVKDMRDLMIKDGATPIKIDTDGIACVPPKEYQGSQELEEKYCDYLTERLEDGIIIEHDGRYDGILTFDKKSYALRKYDGEISIKGNTLRGRNLEHFSTEFIEDAIKDLFEGNEDKIKERYNELVRRIESYEMEANEIVKVQSLNMSLKEYKNRTTSGNTNQIAAYELAIQSPKDLGKGDVIQYYVKQYPEIVKKYHKKYQIKKVKLPAYEAGELIENYNYNYEITYYKKRLEKTCRKFIILGIEKFKELFGIEPKKADIRKLNALLEEASEKTNE